MYFFTRNGGVIRLIKWGNKWVREDPQPISPVLWNMDFAEAEQKLWEQIQAMRREP